MDESFAIAFLEGLLRIPSPSGREATLAAFLAGRMERLGFEVSLDEVGNVLGQIGPRDGPRIVLLGHMDTVPGRLPVRRDGDLLFGRGAVDAKGPLAALVLAAASTQAQARLVVVGAVEEELPSSRGARALVERMPAPDAVVVGEPTGWSGVAIGYKGRVGVTFEVERPPTHTSSAAEKAVEVAAEFWQRLRDALASDDAAADGHFERLTATLTELHGDIVFARARVTCRLPERVEIDELVQLLHGLGAGGRVTLDERIPAVVRDRDDPVVRALAGAIRQHGARPRLKLKSGTSDMNVVADSWGVPVAAFGPGDSTLDHTDEEHLDLEEYLDAVDVLADALESLPDLLEERRPSVEERLRALGYVD